MWPWCLIDFSSGSLHWPYVLARLALFYRLLVYMTSVNQLTEKSRTLASDLCLKAAKKQQQNHATSTIVSFKIVSSNINPPGAWRSAGWPHWIDANPPVISARRLRLTLPHTATHLYYCQYDKQIKISQPKWSKKSGHLSAKFLHVFRFAKII